MQRSNGNTAEQASRRFVVYALTDPRDGLIHYIGATKSLKARLTLHRSLDGGGSGATRRAWLEDLRASEQWPFGVVVLQTVASAEALHDAEREWVRRGRAMGWPLTNMLMPGHRRLSASSISPGAGEVA